MAVLPGVEVRGAIHPVPLLDLPHVADAGPADREGAVAAGAARGRTRSAALRGSAVKGRKPNRRTRIVTDSTSSLRHAPSNQYSFRFVGVDREPVHVDEIGTVHREGPAEIAVVAVQDHRRTGEDAADGVPAFVAVDVRFVPRDRTSPRLVRVDEQMRATVRRTRRRDCEGVGADPRRRERNRRDLLRSASGAPPLRYRSRSTPIEPEEERRAQREAREHVLTAHRKQAILDFVGVQLRVVRETRGVARRARRASRHRGRCRSRARRPSRFRAARRRSRSRAALGPRTDGELPAHAEDHVLDRREVVLGVGIGEAEGGVGVARGRRRAERRSASRRMRTS